MDPAPVHWLKFPLRTSDSSAEEEDVEADEEEEAGSASEDTPAADPVPAGCICL